MVIDVNLKKKNEKTKKTQLSQQMLVNTLLGERQPINTQPVNDNAIKPAAEWSGK